MKNYSILFFFLFTILICFNFTLESSAQIIVDGDFSESQYSVLDIRGNNNPGWGNGTDLTTIYIAKDDSNLYLGFEGSVQRTAQAVNFLGDGIGIFLNFSSIAGVPAGTNLGFDGDTLLHFITGKDKSGISPALINYKADFEVDYSLAFFSDSLGNQLSLSAGSHKIGDTTNPHLIASIDTTDTPITGPSSNGIFSANSIVFAYQDFTGNGSKKGIELIIPYAEFSGDSTTQVQLFAFIVSSNAYFSDITIPGTIKNGSPGFEPDFFTNLKSPNCVCGSSGVIGTGTFHTFDIEQLQSINYSNFRSVEGLTITRAAARLDSVLRLTPAEYAVYGSAWFHEKQFVEAGFETTFKFKIFDGIIGDGFAFVIQNESPDTIGEGGGGIGYANLVNSLAVEFDTYHNGTDPIGHHIAVHINGNHLNAFSYYNGDGNLDIRNQINDVKIIYIPGNLRIIYNEVEVLQTPIYVTNYMNLDQSKAWVGFTASTGVNWDNHYIYDWTFEGIDSSQQISSIFTIEDGWNLVSFPGIHPNSMVADTLFRFRDLSTSVFSFSSSGYNPEDTIKNRIGYWLKHTGQKTYNWNGTVQSGVLYPQLYYAEADSFDGSSGWNIIGVYDYEFLTSELTTNPSGLISGTPFEYNPGVGYQPAVTMQPGKGYWINLSADGKIIYPDRPASSPKLTEEKLIDECWASVTIKDSKGKQYTLYSTSDDGELDKYLLPPKPPVGMFDVRFTTDRFVDDISSEKVIDITGAEYPIRIKVTGMGLMIKDAITGKIFNAMMKEGDEVVIDNRALDKLVLLSDGNTPQQYELAQNYPNPFNPNTTIRFSVPTELEVNLSIFNILGEKVSELKNEVMKPGYYTVEFDASTLASGVYIYRIKAQSFVQSKKMILMK